MSPVILIICLLAGIGAAEVVMYALESTFTIVDSQTPSAKNS